MTGKKQSQTRLYLSPPHMGGEEQAFVKEAFDSNWVSPAGAHLPAFEQELCAYTGAAHAAALSSGTAALHLALRLLGVGAGDDVLCQSFTFAGSAYPIEYCGATPVFLDSEPKTWNLDPEVLVEAIEARRAAGKRIGAVIAVHLYGMPAWMSEVGEICDRYGIPVVEDAAEALGSRLEGRPAGSFGRIAILSFNGNKIITTSGGGALLSDDEALVERARFLATQARDPAPHYQHSVIGYNYRLSNVLAGIGRGQMRVLDDRVKRRREIFAFYREALGNLHGISFPDEPEGCFSNRWLTTILVDPEQTGGVTREDIRLALEAENIESRPLWKPMHLQPVFKGRPFYGNGVSDRLFERGLCLPSGSGMSREDLDRVAACVTRCSS